MISALTWLLFAQLTQLPAQAHQDSTGYGSFGPFEDVRAGSYEAFLIRDFLWRHWSDRKLGRGTVTYLNKHGQGTLVHYLVEPSREGVWGIRRLRSRSTRKDGLQVQDATSGPSD